MTLEILAPENIYERRGNFFGVSLINTYTQFKPFLFINEQGEFDGESSRKSYRFYEIISKESNMFPYALFIRLDYLLNQMSFIYRTT